VSRDLRALPRFSGLSMGPSAGLSTALRGLRGL